ncbi:MAG: hypothetical protein L3J65_03430 [Robiginitomaculum sp.]|nr:hypothetical protein [Robiginitomaculum sp.]
MKRAITGYIYCPRDELGDELGLFQNCSAGQIISKADDNPPWIVVNHSLADVTAAKWPGRLWRAEVLSALEPQGHRGNYTRCISVKIIEGVETEILFGELGTKIEEILEFASTLELPIAEGLAASRHKNIKGVVSKGWHRWMEKNGIADSAPDENMDGVIMIGNGAHTSPIGYGLALVHRYVWESAQREMGDAAFEEGEEEIWLKPPWTNASDALMEAAWALGVPELFSPAEIEILLEGWNQREVQDE